ncbi:hypothetical protein [Catenulispora sp. EB89]|uniref:hypothetical protein n=1 Tax=Catenulispora sp. EB89 TaxID=3156257 RepID=UPI0035113841
MSDRRWKALSALATTVSAIVAVVAWVWPRSADQPTAQGSTSLTAPPAALAKGGSSAGHNATSPPAPGSSYTVSYQAASFTLPGASCQMDGENVSYNPAGADFSAAGPKVWTYLPGGEVWGDITLACFNPLDNTSYLDFAGQVAAITGTPDAAACNAAVSRNPIQPNVRFVDLHVGDGFCQSGGSDKTQLTYLKLDSVNKSTYTTVWSATGWIVPANGSR